MDIANPVEVIEEAGGSLNDRLDRIRMAWSNQHRNADVYSYVVDVFENDVVINRGGYSAITRKYYRLSYTYSDEAVTFAPESEWQEVRLDYVPAGTVDVEESDLLESMRGTIELEEAGGGKAEAVIVVEGINKKGTHEYTVDALRSGIPVFSDARMYADHPTMSEERDRPERSVRDLVGKLGEARVGKDKSGKPALRAPMVISETAGWLQTLVKEGIVDGLSIRAYGKASPSKQGHMVVESFVPNPHTSVDFVTVPSAGGYPELQESVRESFWSAVSVDTIRKHRPDLVAQIKKEPLEESEGQESVILLEEAAMPDKPEQLEEVNRLKAENALLFTQVRTQEANGILADLFTPGLPDITQKKIQQQAEGLVESYATYGSEQKPEQLREALTAMVEAEKKYIARLVQHGNVSGLQPAGGGEPVNVEETLEEAFEGLVPASQIKVAVRGRDR